MTTCEVLATHHVSQRDVQEHAAHSSEDPNGGTLHLAQQHARHHSQEAESRRQDVVGQPLFYCHAGGEQDGEVTCHEITSYFPAETTLSNSVILKTLKY